MKKEYALYVTAVLLITACTFGAIRIMKLEKELKTVKNDVYELSKADLQSEVDRAKSDIEETIGRIDDAEGRIDDLENRTITVTTQSYQY